jgi:hypothetical protein
VQTYGVPQCRAVKGLEGQFKGNATWRKRDFAGRGYRKLIVCDYQRGRSDLMPLLAPAVGQAPIRLLTLTQFVVPHKGVHMTYSWEPEPYQVRV